MGSSQNKYVVNVIQPDPVQEPVITTVTVSPENKNLLEWKQTADENIQYFNIYRDAPNPDDGWINAGKAMYPGNYTFSDRSSFPNVRSYQYRVSTIDKCGNETFNTRIHKTIKLNVVEINDTYYLLKWNAYEGFDIAGYKIYKGLDAANLTLIDSTSNMRTNYIVNESQDKVAYYQVEAIGKADTIKTEKKPSLMSYRTRSNIVSHQSILNSSDTTDALKLQIYPNPLIINAMVLFPYDSAQKYQLSIIDLTGHTLFTEPVLSGEVEVERKNLKEGMYILQIASRKTLKRKLIVGRDKA